MTISIENLRKFRNTSFEKISQGFESVASPNASFTDERFWKLNADKAGNGTAVIRFLSDPSKDTLPWIRIFSHGFKNAKTGRWFIEECPTTIGESCPVCEANGVLYNSGLERDKKIASPRKRKTQFISNILVISDPAKPENNGKVLLYRFGKKIFEKAMDKMKPTFEDEEAINVFDLWGGADFKIRMKKVDGYPNYDTSVFNNPSQVADTDEEIVQIVNSMYDVTEFIQPKKFKSYNDLSIKFNQIVNGNNTTQASDDIPFGDDDITKSVNSNPIKMPNIPDDDDEDTLSYFKQMVDDDIPF